MANPGSHAGRDGPAEETRIGYRLATSLPWFVLPRGIASQVVIDPGLARVPNAKSWLRGVLSLGGLMVPVFDFGDWMEQQRTIDPDCVLVIQPGPEAVAFLCVERPRLLQVREAKQVAAGDRWHGHCGMQFQSELGPAYELATLQWLKGVAAQVPGRSRQMVANAMHPLPGT
ncbi:MAG: chemotaxis protein CheW [Lysobacterales bacterium]